MADTEVVTVITNPERGSGVKMSRKDADAYVAANPGSSIVGSPAADTQADESDDLGGLSKADLQARAEELGLETGGTKAELIERIQGAGSAPQE